MIKIAIIGGTGVYDPRMLQNVNEQEIETPYGSVQFKVGEYDGKEVAFIPRHGSKHSIPPHLINYRANMWALKKVGVENIIATTAVGSLNPAIKPGNFVIVDQFLDFTKSRVSTFFEGGSKGVVHVDVTNPYCLALRDILIKSGHLNTITIHDRGTYVCTEGPRFETAAEVSLFARMGGDVVGMTNFPEVVLAREAEMCYATVSMVTNFGAGISLQPLTHKEVLDSMQENEQNIKNLIMTAVKMIPLERDCSCKHALCEFGGFNL